MTKLKTKDKLVAGGLFLKTKFSTRALSGRRKKKEDRRR